MVEGFGFWREGNMRWIRGAMFQCLDSPKITNQTRAQNAPNFKIQDKLS